MILVRIPLVPRGKAALVDKWPNLPPDSPVWEQVARSVPDCNWGLRLDDLVVADCDSPEAVRWWMENSPTATPVMSSARSDRMAFWFRRPECSQLRTFRLREDVEIRTGSGAQQAVPPSVHPCGAMYRWLPERSVEPEPRWRFNLLPEAPEEWILSQKPAVASWGSGDDGWDEIPEGNRNVALTALGGLLRRHGASRDAIEAALSALNDTLCAGEKLPTSELSKIAGSVAHYAIGGDVTVEIEDDDVGVTFTGRRRPGLIPLQ